MDKTLGAYSILACQKAMDDAGVTADQIDGVICCDSHIAGPSGGSASKWAPRPYFAPPYDSEWGLTLVNAEWLIKTDGPAQRQVRPHRRAHDRRNGRHGRPGRGRRPMHTCLVIYPCGNLEGRYRRGGENADDYAKGARQWTVPWGNHGGNDFINIFPHNQYCLQIRRPPRRSRPVRRSTSTERHADAVGIQRHPWDRADHRGGLQDLALHPESRCGSGTATARCNASTAYLFTTAERARDMRQKPVYVLNHSQHNFKQPSTQADLDEIEMWTDRAAKRMYEGAGLGPKDVDIFNPYDGYASHERSSTWRRSSGTA